MAKAKSHPLKSITFNKPHPVGGWTNPSEKKCSSSWVISPISGSKLKNLEVNHHQSSPKFQSNYIVIIKITKNHPQIITQDVINSSQPDRKKAPFGAPNRWGHGCWRLRSGRNEPQSCTREIRHRSRWILFVCWFFSFLILLRFLLLWLLFIVTVVKPNQIKPDLKGYVLFLF